MYRRHLLAISSMLGASGLAGCLGAPRADGNSITRAAPGTAPDIEDGQLRELVHQTNGFAFDLYRRLIEKEPDANLFSSPVSVSLALAMTYAGAGGKTREQMRDVLRYTLESESIHETFAKLQRELDTRGADIELGEEEDDLTPFELSVANSFWAHEGYPFADTYLELLQTHYDGGLYEVDYTADPEAARNTINNWVADETDGRIDELLPEDSLDVETRFVLISTIYFLGSWLHPFAEAHTLTGSFTALDGTEYEVPIMNRSRREWQYAEVDGARAVDLPYVGEDTSMLVILPPEGEFETYEKTFDGETLSEIVDGLDSREGEIRLPRFTFETELELGEVLDGMGMSDAFTPGLADFSGMVDGEGVPLYINEIYHNALVAVDEEGTKAAAATGVVGAAISSRVGQFVFEANRPFLVVIRDRLTDTVLFLGRVVDPDGWK